MRASNARQALVGALRRITLLTVLAQRASSLVLSEISGAPRGRR
jgi:hypothetical protein